MTTPTRSTLSRRTTRAVAVVALAFGGACSGDRITAPAAETAERSNNLLSVVTTAGNTLIGKQSLLRTMPLAQPVTRSITLNRAGGTLRIPETGLTLTIPRNALGNSPITISVTALPGRAVAYSFEPHGTRFLNNLTLTQDLANTTWAGNSGRVVLGGGYFKYDSQVNTGSGFTLLNELLPITLSGGRAHMSINHFSGYMVSMD